MTEPQPDDATPPPDPVGPDATAAPVDPALERRAFVRRMGTDAVRTAGSVFSLSRILTRSATAAGQAVINELEAAQFGNAAEEVVAANGGPVPAEEVAPAAPPAVVDPLPAADVAPSPAPAAPALGAAALAPPPLSVDADQRAILEAATSAVIAVNFAGRPPQLTSAAVHWDGETLRFATLGWSRRTTMLRSDPHVGVFVDGPGDGRFVTVTGRARIVDGRDARDAMWPLLLAEAGEGEGNLEDAAEARWDELVAADPDRAVIVIEPDQVLTGRR